MRRTQRRSCTRRKKSFCCFYRRMDAECSGTKSDGEDVIWAKLVPSDSRLPEVDVNSKEMVICSSTTCSSLDKECWCKIVTADFSSAVLRNTSQRNIIIDGISLGKEEELIVRCGSEIISGPDKGHATYTFQVIGTVQRSNKLITVPIDIELVKCSICLNTWHDVVSVTPCLHNFCNGCFSQWMNRLLSKRQAVLCPHCRVRIHSVGKNHTLHNLEEVILKFNPSLRRSDEELALLDSHAIIKANFVIKSHGFGDRAEPASVPTSANPVYGEVTTGCIQCADGGFGGFRCNPSTTHLQCYRCGHNMPLRPDIDVPQHCLGCDRSFCGAYWNAEGMATAVSSGLCSSETFRPISDDTFTRMPHSTHQGNPYEQDVTARYIGQSGKTLHDVVTSWCLKLDNGEIDPISMMVNNVGTITSKTYLCNECRDKVVAHLLHCFRFSVPKQHLPTDASVREDCWYGWACRTQHHNPEHARKRNHICHPTRRNANR